MTPTCETCKKPATCFGTYEQSDAWGFACDECCGHGNEDGHCVDDPSKIGPLLNAAIREVSSLETMIYKLKGDIETFKSTNPEMARYLLKIQAMREEIKRLNDELERRPT